MAPKTYQELESSYLMKQKYAAPTKASRTTAGTRPNDSAKPAVPGSGKNRPAKGFDPITKTWNQD